MIDKALGQAPQGIDQLVDDPAEIEIQIVLGEEDLLEAEEEGFDDNLVEYMDDNQLQGLVYDLITDYEDDCNSRRDWMQTYVDGLELLGMKLEERSEPWEGACGVYHPLLSEALVKFQAETMMSSFPAAGCVRTEIVGKETPEKKAAAARVEEDMNYQLMEVMTEYRPEHERMLWGLGLSGNAFKKVYYDPALERQVSMFIPAEDIVVPYGASNLETSPRVTHVMRKTANELRRLQVAGYYIDVDLGEPVNHMDDVERKISEKMGFNATSDDRHKVLEMHVELDLPGYEHVDDEGELTGIQLPYVVTIEKTTNTILAIRRNWNPDDKTNKKRQHFVHYGYVPGFGFYCFGLIHLVGAFAKSGTSLIRQLVDAGTLSNLPGGFKARGLRVKGEDTPISPGEFRDVDVPSGTIRDNLMPLPYKEPSQVLMALLGQIVEEGRRFANAADLQISDMSGQAPVGTTLAILERTLKVMSAVQARIHYSMRQELRLLKGIIAEYTPDHYDYDPDEGSRKAKKADYSNVAVMPVSDPNASTMAQKIVQYQAALQLAQTAPQLYNLALLHRQMLDVLGVKGAGKLIPMPEDIQPMDPISENQNALTMKPMKAFLNQDHQAHITVHQAMVQDPKIQATLAANPMAQHITGGLMAHIMEHMGFQYRKDIEQQLGFTLPPKTNVTGEDISLNPEVEAQLSPVLGQAAQQLLQGNQQHAAQQQAQQQAQDPLIQMQMQEIQLKGQEQQRKTQKDQTDAQLKMQEIQVERERIDAQKAIATAQLQAELQKTTTQVSSKAGFDDRKLKVDTALSIAKLGSENKRANSDRLVDSLATAAEIHNKNLGHQMDLGHQGIQAHMERQAGQQEKVIDIAHQRYQKHLDRQTKMQGDMLKVAHETMQNHLDRQQQQETVSDGTGSNTQPD